MTPRLKITGISCQPGYNDAEHLTRAFKAGSGRGLLFIEKLCKKTAGLDKTVPFPASMLASNVPYTVLRD
jgi:hypothetical protein